MRLVVLYARSRHLPAASLVVLMLCGAGVLAGHWLVTRPSLDPTTASIPVTVALAVAVAVVLAGTLHSPADEVERTTPRPWHAWRAGHGAAAAVVATLLVTPVLPAAAYGQQALLRNTAGLLGLGLLAAVAVGPRLAWTLPLGYAATAYLAAGTAPGDGREVWALIMQPGDSGTALIVALLLLAAGTAAWASTARIAMR